MDRTACVYAGLRSERSEDRKGTFSEQSFCLQCFIISCDLHKFIIHCDLPCVSSRAAVTCGRACLGGPTPQKITVRHTTSLPPGYLLLKSLSITSHETSHETSCCARNQFPVRRAHPALRVLQGLHLVVSPSRHATTTTNGSPVAVSSVSRHTKRKHDCRSQRCTR